MTAIIMTKANKTAFLNKTEMVIKNKCWEINCWAAVFFEL